MMKRLVVVVVVAVVAVMVRVDCAMAQTKGQGVDAPSIKQVLLDRKGFDMHYSCRSRSGWSRVFFHEDGKKILADVTVVDIKNVDINKSENFMLESCTGGAQLMDDGIMFTGCSDESRNIFLAYDPGNMKAPFKGSGRDCASIELSPR
jgi:hypothetical protein